MQSIVRQTVAGASLACAVVLGTAGCSFSASTTSAVAPAAVEEQIRTQLGTETATCPEGLDGEVGAKVTCSATAGGRAFDVAVTVTSVDNGTVKFDIERVGAPPPVPSPSLATEQADGPAVAGPDAAQAVSAELTRITGRTADSVTCPDLPATLGSVIRCELVDGGQTYGVTVTVTAVDPAGRVKFDVAVDDSPS